MLFLGLEALQRGAVALASPADVCSDSRPPPAAERADGGGGRPWGIRSLVPAVRPGRRGGGDSSSVGAGRASEAGIQADGAGRVVWKAC